VLYFRHHRPTHFHLHFQATEAHGASLLNVSAMTLANLCVAYIMISDNEKAEEVCGVRYFDT
jgi:hypothetical protein